MATTPRVSLEQVLGRAEDRYFARGHRSVRYSLQAGELPGSLEGSATFSAKALYGDGWSRDPDGVSRVPHLSSVDAIALAAIAGQRIASSLSSHWVTGIELRAGIEPWLALAQIPVTVRLHEDADGLPYISGDVGNIHTVLHLCSSAQLGHPEGTDGWSVYAAGRRRSESMSSIIFVDKGQRALHSSHEFYSDVDSHDTYPSGMEASFWPSLTAVDYLVTMGQLSQALVYVVNDLDRGRVGNLWMRRMRIQGIAQPEPLPARMEATTRITKDVVIDRGRGRVHSLAVSSETTNGVKATASLAFTEIEGV